MPARAAVSLLLLLGLAACGEANLLNPPHSSNAERTSTLWAIRGTPLFQPSAWSIQFEEPVRLDQNPNFDFAFDIDDAGRAVLLPLGVFGVLQRAGNPGLFQAARPWDEILLAEVNGYLIADTIPVVVGDRLYARSAISISCFSRYPLYAKLEVQAIDAEQRTLTFRILSNLNCGYKGLEPGFPSK